jgi:hypothetical protein
MYLSDLCVVVFFAYSNLSIDYCTNKIVEFHIIIINIKSLFILFITKENIEENIQDKQMIDLHEDF